MKIVLWAIVVFLFVLILFLCWCGIAALGILAARQAFGISYDLTWPHVLGLAALGVIISALVGTFSRPS